MMAVKKTSAKKKAAPKASPKKATVKKSVAKPNAKAIPTKQTKTQIINSIAEDTGLTKKDVAAVFGSLSNLIEGHMKKRGSGEFTIPDSGVKIRRIKKPATKSRKMLSPFTGEEITVKAKPARNVIKVAPLKALKDAVTK
ncbi:HU family DNA-binding protein [Thiohalomonas denitrificans]|uniref:Viral histone-like protein n=1 Tax=Thiohalomonas denitrificans TaxID=415747 RepID=A0A1G5PSB6_9GAMM|nr:HU family DNA-binding protein [Thiohalomonas denitrificans]SCZ52080.1 nucleoid DNA-binding protein [Thiohalomonas denitrificans]